MKQHYLRILLIFAMFFSSLLLSGCFDNSLSFFVRFQQVAGLKQGNHVYFGKNEIGQVEKVTYTKEGVFLVKVKITPEFKNATTENSKFYIGYAPADGSSMAVLVEQEHPGDVVLKDGVTVEGIENGISLNNIFKNLRETAGKAESKLNETLENMKKSLEATSEEMSHDLETTIDDLSSQLESFNDELGRIPDSDEVKQLEENVKQFLNEFQKAQKDVQDRLRNEVIPQFRMELERLREQFKGEGHEEEMKIIDKQEKELEMV